MQAKFNIFPEGTNALATDMTPVVSSLKGVTEGCVLIEARAANVLIEMDGPTTGMNQLETRDTLHRLNMYDIRNMFNKSVRHLFVKITYTRSEVDQQSM
jgi:hypothetical protein